MALTVILDADPERPEAGLALTVDGPRIVLGRGAGCEILIPDATISSRHATIRREGAKTIIMDEGSMNGTQVGTVRLPAQTPRVLRNGDWVRVGRVWLQIELGAAVPSTSLVAQGVALEYVARRLAKQGEPAAPTVAVPAGSDAGKVLVLTDFDHEYLVGSSDEADLVLEDEGVSRRHLGISRQGVELVVRDLGSKKETHIGGRALVSQSSVWIESQDLVVGNTILQLDDPVAQALEEVLTSGDLRMHPDELREPPPGRAAEQVVVEAPADPLPEDIVEDELLAEEYFDDAIERESEGGGGIGIDLLVALVAVGLLALSITALVFLWG